MGARPTRSIFCAPSETGNPGVVGTASFESTDLVAVLFMDRDKPCLYIFSCKIWFFIPCPKEAKTT